MGKTIFFVSLPVQEEGQIVTVLDNFFTGSLKNVERWLQHPRFHVVEWDVILPIHM